MTETATVGFVLCRVAINIFRTTGGSGKRTHSFVKADSGFHAVPIKEMEQIIRSGLVITKTFISYSQTD